MEIPRLATTGSVIVAAVNDKGIAVGHQDTEAAPRAWMYQQSSGTLNELTFDPAESGASANGISNSGFIAGEEIRPQGGPMAGFWTVTGGAMLLPSEIQGPNWAVAANDDGTILGDFGAAGFPGSAALMWTPPEYALTVLPGLQCDYCARLGISADAINSSGTAVGSSLYSVYSNGDIVDSGLFAVVWQSGTVTSLGSLQDSGSSAAYGINDGGDIVGASRVGPDFGAPTHAFLYHDGVMIDLGTLPGDTNSAANSINISGQIVGSSDDGYTRRAFLYEDGQMHDLNTLIAPTSALAGQVTLENAVSISSNGWIAVNGTDSRDAGWTRAFLLIPSD